MIGVIDYKAGNIGSVLNMMAKLGIDAEVVQDARGISGTDKLILPGVGNFGYGMQQLELSGLVAPIREAVIKNNKPILGICLGAQLLGLQSEEGNVSGLGLLDFRVVAFDRSKMSKLKIPHMGWSEIALKKESRLFPDTSEIPRFYFVHSYHFLFGNESDVLATADYGYTFAAAFERGNIFGVQFHPEKSHHFGLELLRNFSRI